MDHTPRRHTDLYNFHQLHLPEATALVTLQGIAQHLMACFELKDSATE